MARAVSRVRSPSSLPLGRDHSFALRRGRAQWTWLILGIILLLALPAVLPTFWLHLVNLSLLAVVGSIALNLLCGNARLISLGHAAFLGVGGFCAGLLGQFYDPPFLVVLLVATVLGALLGLIVAVPSLRLRVLYVAVTTLALHFAVTTLLNVLQAVTLDSAGMIVPIATIGPWRLDDALTWYYFLLAIAAGAVIIALNLLRSFVGRRWMAVAEHDVAAEALGVSVIGAKLSVFVVSSGMTAFAGALGGYYLGTVSFELYSLGLAITYLAMIIVGGVGSVLGSVLGAVLITFLPYLLDQVMEGVFGGVSISALSGFHEILYGGLIIGFLLFEPRGLAEIWRRIRIAAADWPFRYRTVQRMSR